MQNLRKSSAVVLQFQITSFNRLTTLQNKALSMDVFPRTLKSLATATWNNKNWQKAWFNFKLFANITRAKPLWNIQFERISYYNKGFLCMRHISPVCFLSLTWWLAPIRISPLAFAILLKESKVVNKQTSTTKHL